MAEVVISVVGAVLGTILSYFIQKALDKLWNSHFPPSNKNTAP